MNFTNIYIYPIYPDSLNIQWELDNTQLPGVYKFIINNTHIIYNRYNYILPYEILSTSSKTDIKIECIPPIIDERRNIMAISKTVHIENNRNIILAREITRKENLRFSKQVGLKCKVYKRITYGERCPICLDKMTNTITNSQCPKCYGTGYGYYEPTELWAELVQDPVKKEATDVGTVSEKTGTYRLTNEILVSKKDIIVIDNIAWELSTEPQITMYRNYPIGQLISSHALAPKHIFYNILL